MYYAVIDTNVIVAALLTRHDDSATRKILQAIEDGKITPLCSREIVNEYRAVLSRPKFRFDPSDVSATIEGIAGNALYPEQQESAAAFIDETDRVFYEIAIAGPTGCSRLVTGNIRHYPVDPIVVTPAQMIALLEGDNTPPFG